MVLLENFFFLDKIYIFKYEFKIAVGTVTFLVAQYLSKLKKVHKCAMPSVSPFCHFKKKKKKKILQREVGCTVKLDWPLSCVFAVPYLFMSV